MLLQCVWFVNCVTLSTSNAFCMHAVASIHPLTNVHPKKTLQQLQAKIDENDDKNNRKIL